ncbi:Flotillin-like protein [Thalictrum thalictroides]|uniref:Flotillin-like n=1 Tax=Thalictrum thalictroides TaxID=46969 RepID=A0A7J6V8I2_THATH|nr:Flotillin-like protein [Thalictrum thalictroides]
MEESLVFTTSEIPDAEKIHGEISVASDVIDFKSDITEVVDDRVVQLNSKRGVFMQTYIGGVSCPYICGKHLDHGVLLVQEANAELYRKQNAGEVVLFEEEKTAEAQKMNAEAALFARQQAVAGELFAKQKEAEGLMAVAHAQGVYVQTLLNVFAGNYVVMRDYLMINNGVYQEIAKTNARDVVGLKPNISV